MLSPGTGHPRPVRGGRGAPRLYLAHPISTYGRPLEARSEARVRAAFRGWEVFNPKGTYQSWRHFLRTYPEQVARCQALVLFADRGAVAYGVVLEVERARELGLPVLLLAGGSLYRRWSLEPIPGGTRWGRYARARPRGRPARRVP